jgi:hypothetical protein
MSFAEDSSKRRYMNAKVVFLHDRVRPYVGDDFLLGDHVAGPSHEHSEDIQCPTPHTQRQPGTRQQALLRKESKRTERMHQIADAVPL